MSNLREIGSKWRRWDLHLHTPGTVHADQFAGWEPYLRAIEEQNQVIAIGVTDYLSIANYSRMRQEKAAGRLSNIQLMLPNVEFRITPATKHGRGINVHLLVSPDDPEHATRIEEAMARLTFDYKKQLYGCGRQQLIALGRAVNPELANADAALREGANQFKIEFGASASGSSATVG